MTNIQSDAVDGLLRKVEQRREYHLRGAWRAGYDYVHVYRRPPSTRPLGRIPLKKTFSIHGDLYVPSNTEKPPDRRPARYRCTYDIGSIPDVVLRRAIRGELNWGCDDD